MILIGEKINSSIPSSKTIIEARDADALAALAKAQSYAGATFIDINAGTFLTQEGELLAFMAKAIQERLSLRLSIDTPSPEAAAAALKAIGKGSHLLNSVTLEPKRLQGMTSLAAEYGCGLIALCMPESGMPENDDDRLRTAGQLVEHLTKSGIAAGDIYIDPMLHPLGAEEGSGVSALAVIGRLRSLYPECHISVGLSNLSFGLPKRRLINRAFAVAAMAAGLDAAIADPLDKDLMGLIAATEAVLGRDEYCIEYIGKCREGEI